MDSNVSNRPSEQAAYQDLFEKMLDPVFLVDCDEPRILDLNDSAERFLGLSRGELLHGSMLQWCTETEREEFARALRIARRRYHPRVHNSVWVLPDGRTRELEASLCGLTLKDGSTVIQLIAKDVTEARSASRKNAEYLRELEELNTKLEALSTTDEMTGLPNFRRFREDLQKEHTRASRYSSVYSVVFCDVDHFKVYNDLNGHPAGDEVLRRVGKIIRECCRNTDLPARYGGEEFAVLCPETPRSGGAILADRIRGAVEKGEFEFGHRQPLGKLTLSIGVSSFPEDGKTADEVLEAADQALYQSKKGGRNRVTLFERSPA